MLTYSHRAAITVPHTVHPSVSLMRPTNMRDYPLVRSVVECLEENLPHPIDRRCHVFSYLVI
jgi:hypothetical protein